MTLAFDEVLDEDRRRRLLWTMPAGLYVLGTSLGPSGPFHAMTVSLVTQVATDPCVLVVAVETGAKTHGLVTETRRGALSILRRDQRALVRRFVKPDLAVDLDASGALQAIADVAMRRTPAGLPYVADALGCLELELLDARPFASHSAFFFTVTAIALDPVVVEGPASARVAEVLRMEDTKMNYGG